MVDAMAALTELAALSPDGGSMRAPLAGHHTRTLMQDGGDDPCAQEELRYYNMGLHIGSVFILLGVSLLGSLAPVALHISSTSKNTTTAIRLGTYFGFGTILSTAFIHMQLPAVESLSNSCLPAFWTETYEAWPFLFCTTAVMCMQSLDFLIKGFLRRQGVGLEMIESGHAGDSPMHGCHTAVIGAMLSIQPPAILPPSQSHDAEAGEFSESGEAVCPRHGQGCSALLKHKPDTSRTVGIYFTEAGIMFHSVMIGLTLGVASGTSFDTLLAALSFHQLFEGFALGSAAVDAGLSSLKCSLLGLAYSVTTPVGIAIGIGVHQSFNSNSTSNLLATGILDSLAAGILIYVVLVQLITPCVTDSAWLHTRRWPIQVLAFVCFYAGAAAMAVIGKWA